MTISTVTTLTVGASTKINEIIGKLNNQADKIAFGSFSGTTNGSGALSVSHGLSWTPTAVFLAPSTPNGGSTSTRFTQWSVGSLGASSFTIQRAVSQDGTLLTTTSITGFWVALG